MYQLLHVNKCIKMGDTEQRESHGLAQESSRATAVSIQIQQLILTELIEFELT